MQKILFLFLTLLFQVTLKAQTSNDNVLHKVGTTDSLYSVILGEQRNIFVQFPAEYSENGNKKYPVVFILDGDVLLPTVENVQSFYSGGFTPEMVLIGISNDKNRTRDLTTSIITEKYGMPFHVESGGADEFGRFIEEELIPYVEKKYPVTNFRTLIGHSYGGLFTIYTLIHSPALFSNYIAIDPSLDWDNQKLLREAQEKFPGQNYEGKSLFMALSGQLNKQDPNMTIDNVMKDTTLLTLFPRSNITFSNLVKQNNKNGLAFEWKFYPRDLHGTIPYPSIMDGMIFNFEWYQMENTDKFNSPLTPKEELFKIINYRAGKLETYFGYMAPPYPEDVLNVLGDMSIDMAQLEKAKMFFEFAIKFYPDSGDGYHSMANYYEKNNDYNNAIKYLSKALELSGNDSYRSRIEELKKK